MLRQVYPKMQRFVGYSARRQRGRVFNRAKTGVIIARHRGETLRWLTLTTPKGYDKRNLSVDMVTLRKRIEHVSYDKDGFNPFSMEFIKVTTSEGNGVIHALFKARPVPKKSHQCKLNSHVRRAKGGRPLNEKYDIGYIKFNWLKANWAEIVGNPKPDSQHVYIEYVYGSAERVAGYLCQYAAGQDKLERLSFTNGWLYRGCVKDWNERFKPHVALLMSYRCSLEEEQFNADMRALYKDWDNWVIGKVT
jgi:hypothetical protein